jgi:selenoprotein W-related protein
LLGDFPRAISSLTLRPSGGGVFEVTVNGELVFSKKALNRHPDYAEIKSALARFVA